jgi:hypothetical protein
MIIDIDADPARASLYRILDAETGKDLNHMRIFYADDEAGLYRHYLADESGFLLVDEGGELRWAEVRRPIRLALDPRYLPGAFS